MSLRSGILSGGRLFFRNSKSETNGKEIKRSFSTTKIAAITLTGIAATWILSPTELQDRAVLRALQTPSGHALLGPEEVLSGEVLESTARFKLAVKLRAANSLRTLSQHASMAELVASDAALLDAALRSCAVSSKERSNETLPEWRKQHHREILAVYTGMWEALVEQLPYESLMDADICGFLRTLIRGTHHDLSCEKVGHILSKLLVALPAPNKPLNATNSSVNSTAQPPPSASLVGDDGQKFQKHLRFREVFEAIGVSDLLLLSQASPQNDSFRIHASESLVKLSLSERQVDFIAENALDYLLSLPLGRMIAADDPHHELGEDDITRYLWSNAINTLANLAHLNADVASQVLQSADIELFLRSNVDLPDCARCVANLSRAEKNKAILADRGWVGIVNQSWLSSHVSGNTKVAGLVILNNLARQVDLAPKILQQISIKRLIDVCEQHSSDHLLGTLIARLTLQILMNLSRDAASIELIFRCFDNHGDNLLLKLKSIIDRLYVLHQLDYDSINPTNSSSSSSNSSSPSSLSNSSSFSSSSSSTTSDRVISSDPSPPMHSTDHNQLYQLLARTLGYVAASSDPLISESLLSDPNWWSLILVLSSLNDIATLRESARTIANIVSHVENSTLIRSKHAELLPLLTSWTKSSDATLSMDAIRAQATLFSLDVSAAKYVDGIYLLHPTEQADADQAWLDIVFIHGVTGHPLGTWKVGNPTDENEAAIPLQGTRAPAAGVEDTAHSIWPKEWLASQFPQTRIMSVGYEVQLSKWVGNSLPLREQSKIIAQQLRLAALGDRPIVFVCHSFGGLLVKELLMYASDHPDFQSITKNTLGVAFYATPHRGAELSRLSENPILDRVVRSTSVVYELHPENERLDLINRFFSDNLSDRISTLSFAESQDTCIAGVGSQKICFQIVPDQSADPKFPGELHSFFRLPHNHRAICKPFSKEDDRYRLLAEWLQKIWDPIQALQSEKQERLRRQLEMSGEFDELVD